MQTFTKNRNVFVAMAYLKEDPGNFPVSSPRDKVILGKSVCYVVNALIKKESRGVCTHLDGDSFLTVLYESCQEEALHILEKIGLALRSALHLDFHFQMGVLTDFKQLAEPIPCYSKNVDSVIAYLDQNYQHITSLQEVADHVGLCPTYLSSKFKEEVGVGLIEYLNQIRLEEARILIAGNSMPLKSIIYSVGFTSYPYFSNLFRKKYQISPSEYRKKATKIPKKLAV